MGVVYEAQDSHLDRAIALKLLPHDALANPARKQRFVQEAKTASALNHPHIVTIYDIASADGTDYIAMELIRGRTLEKALSRGKLRLAEVLKYGVQIADALAAAHAAGIVHRDLKPGNIMVTERGEVKVLDFGLAKLIDESEISEVDETRTQRAVTEEGAVVGSAPYMSPEQAEGRKVDARSDIFSFGSVLYEMLTGKRAFEGPNRAATMASILKDEPEPVSKLAPEIPREVERWVMRCLRKDLDRRSQSMAEIRVALQDLKDESESGSLGSAPAAGAPRTRPRWPYYAAGAVLAAGTLAAFWFFRPSLQAQPLRATVITSFVGVHYGPSLSPDGSQFAFTWDGDVPKGNQHVYISLVGKGTPLRLTPEDETALSPSWSPDGQSIAFLRPTRTQGAELMVMPALGGPGRRIAQGLLSAYPAAWSPDAKWLLWSQSDGGNFYSLRVAPSAGGEARDFTGSQTTGNAGTGDVVPAISPDGRQVAWIRRFANHDEDLFVAGFQDGRINGSPRQLTHDHTRRNGLVWTHDGKEIIYTAGEATSELSINRVPASGGEPRRIAGIGANAVFLALAPKANRLLYSTASANYDIRRLDLNAGPDAKAERFLSSTRYEVAPSYSPDGKRIAFSSNRGGVRQIWVADADGTNSVPLTSFASGIAGSPKWSPDGQTIAFDARPEGNADVYTIPSAGGPVKRLTEYVGEDVTPTWSPDGKWIFFISARAGRHEVFRMHPDGSVAQQITKKGGEFGMVSPDGKWLYYSVLQDGIWKIAPEGGETTQFLPKDAVYGTQHFVVKATGIFGFEPRRHEEKGDRYPFVFHPFDGGKPRMFAWVDRPPQFFPDVSPDGRWFLYSTSDDPVYEMMLVDGFR
jgi:Tol biopolymer transport system component/tRNA A-37 threonylcarbamoyl transferase component Bud32